MITSITTQAGRTIKQDHVQGIIRLAALGFHDKEIAWEIGLSENTVKLYNVLIKSSLGLRHRTQYVALALREKLLTLEELYAQLPAEQKT